ncbi:hypothetical protein AOCH_007145, partial [Aspergillus ochraceoroseus]
RFVPTYPCALGRSEQDALTLIATNEPPLSLRSMQHLDRDGKVIADPDRSNPTRARLERPLDTIRGFEAAIEARRGQNIL